MAPKGDREEAGEPLCGAKFVQISWFFPIRQAVPGGLAQASFCSWALWAPFLIEKKKYYSIYSVFAYNVPFYKCLGRWEWVDGPK